MIHSLSIKKFTVTIECRRIKGQGMSYNQVDQIVGKNITRIRLAKNISLERLSEKTGLSVDELSRVEAGALRLSTDRLRTVIKTLDVDIYMIFEMSDKT